MSRFGDNMEIKRQKWVVRRVWQKAGKLNGGRERAEHLAYRCNIRRVRHCIDTSMGRECARRQDRAKKAISVPELGLDVVDARRAAEFDASGFSARDVPYRIWL
jgi:hypothetical protein